MITRTIFKRLLILPPILAGAMLIAWQISGRPAPEQSQPSETARPIRFIVAAAGDYVPRALGYGYVKPGKVWEAVAEVAGKIVYRHPDLERGRRLNAGTVILRIDPTDYELAVTRAKAGLEGVAARLNEIAVRDANTTALLGIQRRALALAEADLDRKKKLMAKGNASQASVDLSESTLLARRQGVQDLQNLLALNPAERRVLEADRALKEVELAQAKLDLARTAIHLPFDARIAEVTTEETQFAAVNQTLVLADSVDVAEISAQMAFDHVRSLVPPGQELGALNAPGLSGLPRHWGLSASVRLRTGGLSAAWEARFERVSDAVETQTRTIGFIVAVDDPYRKIIPGIRPPLIKNMFVEVELRTPARPGTIVAPRAALHDGPQGGPAVYLATADNRLEIRPVATGAAQSDFIVVREGLAPGDRLIVSDLAPAIQGMLLAPRRDDTLATRLRDQAAGKTSLR